MSIQTDVSEADSDAVEQLLGRRARGLKSVVIRSDTGSPVVIQVSSLVDGKPFPTLFWLVDKQLKYAIDRMEAAGFIKYCQASVDASSQLQQDLAVEHQAYIDLRQQLISEEEEQAIERLGFSAPLKLRGIGGIQDFKRIRCLHTYYAAHLVQPNSVGAMVNLYWTGNRITFEQLSCIG